MPIVRQMSELYLRGSLVNVTMKNLTEKQRRIVDEVVALVSKHPDMQAHKRQFIKALQHTIAADYADDPLAAEEEFHIAIWRAVVDLLYHRKYTFKCTACDTTTLKTQRGKTNPLDRIYDFCPSCRVVLVMTAGDTSLPEGEFVNVDEFQDSFKFFLPRQESPTCKSPIIAIPGEKKYPNHQAVLDCPTQLKKFFGEYMWNYYRQHIKENKRTEHRKEPQRFIGRADEVAIEEIVSACLRHSVKFEYSRKINPYDGAYRISVQGMITPAEFTAELGQIIFRAKANDVEVICTRSEIAVVVNDLSPICETQLFKPEFVHYVANRRCAASEDEPEYYIDSIGHRTVKGTNKKVPDPAVLVEMADTIDAIKRAVPDGDHTAIFEIFSEQGPAFEAFSNEYEVTNAPIKNVDVARFLGISVRTVGDCKKVIKHYMLAHDLVPSSRPERETA